MARRSNPRRDRPGARDATVRWLRSQGRPCWVCGLPVDYGARYTDPLAFECDELVPVSRGGSPTDRDNVAAAHRCCNGWRKARSVAEVAAIRAAILSRGLRWSSPLEFVELAKGARSQGVATGRSRQVSKGAPTTDW